MLPISDKIQGGGVHDNNGPFRNCQSFITEHGQF